MNMKAPAEEKTAYQEFHAAMHLQEFIGHSSIHRKTLEEMPKVEIDETEQLRYF